MVDFIFTSTVFSLIRIREKMYNGLVDFVIVVVCFFLFFFLYTQLSLIFSAILIVFMRCHLPVLTKHLLQ